MDGCLPLIRLSPRDFDAALFDLDGVLTRTAELHAAAWKRLFDEFLADRQRRHGGSFVPFDDDVDYRRYVDGKPREDGVRSFLESRDIRLPDELPAGEAGDSVRDLARRKDGYFLERLADQGVAVYDAAVDLVRGLRRAGIRTAVVSSSRNCAAILDAAGITELFDVRVDGNDLAKRHLRGKPAPDAFLEAAAQLGVEPSRALIVEDAVAGVEAGRAGGFALVIGVDNGGQSQRLRTAGADVVVCSLAEVELTHAAPSGWSLVYTSFDPVTEGRREALCALGNGYFGTRAAMPWARADGVHYPGCYLAGGYNRMETEIEGRVVENEDLVNLPNWLDLRFRLEGDDAWFDLRRVSVSSFRQELDLRHGVLLRCLVFEDAAGRRSRVEERRFLSMANMHVAALELSLTAENWRGRVMLRSGIDGRVVNAGAKIYAPFNNRHLVPLEERALDRETILLLVRTTQSQLRVAQAVRTRIALDGRPHEPVRELVTREGYVGQSFEVTLAEGQTVTIEKVLAMHTSRDLAISEPGVNAEKTIARADGFAALLAAHELEWKLLWRRFDIHLRPSAGGFNLNVPMLLRMNMLHLLQTSSHHSIGRDVGVPARGLTGEHYQGHIFWDELYIFPTLNFRAPEITRSLLMYRYRRLDEARAAAREAGYAGAMFPWQSGSDGQEETQELNPNPFSGRLVPDNSWRQRHVGSAIAWNVWQYCRITRDEKFLQFYGAEMIFEIARFWASIASFDAARGRYEIRGVMGPDEFHEGYPGETPAGVDNNAYTNVMAAWVLLRALDTVERLPRVRRLELEARLGLTADELERWRDVARHMYVPLGEDGLIRQFDGWDALEELDWDSYRARYGNIQRLDLILESEGDTANRYKLCKQPDVLMLFYLFSSEALCELFAQMGYRFDPAWIPLNVAYYDARTSLGSTLSRVVHAWVLARSNRPRAMAYFADALQSDLNDIQGGTTEEGIHLGAMAGTVDLIQRVALGLEIMGDALRIDPRLPDELARLDLRIHYRGHWLDIRLRTEELVLRSWDSVAEPIDILVCNDRHVVEAGDLLSFPLRPQAAPPA
ncbi:MAG TPA: beta-phosphoglucomutase family hydrolase [Pseudomonadales bacterium]